MALLGQLNQHQLITDQIPPLMQWDTSNANKKIKILSKRTNMTPELTYGHTDKQLKLHIMQLFSPVFFRNSHTTSFVQQTCCCEGLLAFFWQTFAAERAVKHANLMLLHSLHMRSHLMFTADRNDGWTNQSSTPWPHSSLSPSLPPPSSKNNMKSLLFTFSLLNFYPHMSDICTHVMNVI